MNGNCQAKERNNKSRLTASKQKQNGQKIALKNLSVGEN